jgi:hypothetical protein
VARRLKDRKEKGSGATRAKCLIVATIFFCVSLYACVPAAQSAKPKSGSWESWVLRGNEYRDRGRSPNAIRNYATALKILEKQGIDDLRKAIVQNNIAEVYRADNNKYAACMWEVRATTIYKREIDNHQLGYEYASRAPIDFNSGSLRPMCYLCHENWKVVPVLYGKSSGYTGEVPSEDDPAFTHKPGGAAQGDQRWYCRDCRQTF